MMIGESGYFFGPPCTARLTHLAKASLIVVGYKHNHITMDNNAYKLFYYTAGEWIRNTACIVLTKLLFLLFLCRRLFYIM